MKTLESVSLKTIVILSLIIVLALSACGQSRNVNQSALNMNNISKPENPYYSHTDTTKLNLTDAEWKKILPEELYEVSRHAATERPFTGKYWNADIKGTLITVQLVAEDYFAQKLNLQAHVAGQAFLSRKIRKVLYSDQIHHWEWKGRKYFAADAEDI